MTTKTRLGQTYSDTQDRPILADYRLEMAARAVDEAEDFREKTAAHLGELRRLYDRPVDDPEVVLYTQWLADAQGHEKRAIKNLEVCMARHPLGAWQQQQTGIGAKQLGRLLGAILDPYWNSFDDKPRGVYSLWRYCGLDPVDGVGRRRKRGERGGWNPDAKSRVYLIAEKCTMMCGGETVIKTGPRAGQTRRLPRSPYRDIYDTEREKYADAVHAHPCAQCGTPGKPAEVGSALRLGHQKARAVRKVAKTILKDLWRESKRLHELQAAANGVTSPTVRPPLSAQKVA